MTTAFYCIASEHCATRKSPLAQCGFCKWKDNQYHEMEKTPKGNKTPPRGPHGPTVAKPIS